MIPVNSEHELAEILRDAAASSRDGDTKAALDRMLEADVIASTLSAGDIARVASPIVPELVRLAITLLADGDREAASRAIRATTDLLDAMVEKDVRFATNAARDSSEAGRALSAAGHYKDAFWPFLKASMHMANLGRSQPAALVQAAQHMNEVAIAVRYGGDPAEATMFHAKAYELLQAAPGTPMDHLWPTAFIAASNAVSQWMCQRYDEAEKGFRFALAAYERLPIDTTDRRIEVAQAENNFGNVLFETGRASEALLAYRRAEEHWSVIAAERPEHLGDLETTRRNLVDAERRQVN